jgi:lipopolysaccharide/colanic/teichoic acid biosynthesis glycosyltransferase
MKGTSPLDGEKLDSHSEKENDSKSENAVFEKFLSPNSQAKDNGESTETSDGGALSIPFWKRALDLTFIVLTFPVWLPLMALAALLIKTVSRGPVFFRQQRIGLGGAPFMILKFRSMKVNAETRVHEGHLERLIRSDCPMTKLDSSGDSRLIRGGGIFRATGLDELPQLFNVIRGEMSLVGPRPCTLHEFSRYQPCQSNARIKVPPGLTGNWQVNGKNKTTFSQMIAMDLHYAENLSLRFDLMILSKTIPAIFQQVIESRKRPLQTAARQETVPAMQAANQAAN